ncbi:MAG: acyl--CoA ligase [Fimbriimonadia bacterium]|jgi:long-chain acyl-CoA synthetase
MEDLDATTRENIRAARDMSHRPFEQRMTKVETLGELIEMQATRLTDKPWLTYYQDGEAGSYTYGEFYRDVCHTAGFLRYDLGLGVGDRIALLSYNHPLTVQVYFAAWLAGVCVVPINASEDDERIQYIQANAEARAIFVMPDYIDRYAALRSGENSIEHFVQMMGEPRADYVQMGEAIAPHPVPFARPDYGPETESLVVYTSGTTGPPKGVVLEQYNHLADAHSIAEWHRMSEGERMMCVLPIHHVNGIIVTLCTPLYYGGSVLLHRRFSATSFWKTLSQYRVGVVSVVPTVLAFLCEKNEDISAYDFGAFRHFICGAGPLTVELGKRFEEQFDKVIQHGYGLSETTCYDCFLPLGQPKDVHNHWMRDYGFPSIGCPISCNEMAIHDPDGRPLPEKERGEIVIRGHCVMKGYFKRPDANRDTFKHQWFRSGDEGFWVRGEDGLDYYFITGRLKELIIRGGVNYSPLEIDEVINSIEGVKAGMAVGFENDMYGEEIGAYVVLEEGATLTEDDILRACAAALPFNKRPKVVVFGEEFPVTSTGKYQRNKLKPLFAQWRGTQFRE